jgi:hypothetical protein
MQRLLSRDGEEGVGPQVQADTCTHSVSTEQLTISSTSTAIHLGDAALYHGAQAPMFTGLRGVGRPHCVPVRQA